MSVAQESRLRGATPIAEAGRIELPVPGGTLGFQPSAENQHHASLPGEVVLHSGTPLPSFYSHNLQSGQRELDPHPSVGNAASYRWTMAAYSGSERIRTSNALSGAPV